MGAVDVALTLESTLFAAAAMKSFKKKKNLTHRDLSHSLKLFFYIILACRWCEPFEDAPFIHSHAVITG